MSWSGEKKVAEHSARRKTMAQPSCRRHHWGCNYQSGSSKTWKHFPESQSAAVAFYLGKYVSPNKDMSTLDLFRFWMLLSELWYEQCWSQNCSFVSHHAEIVIYQGSCGPENPGCSWGGSMGDCTETLSQWDQEAFHNRFFFS